MRVTIRTFIIFAAFLTVSAQSSEFTYQGQLQNASVPATGVFDLEFALFDSPAGGTQIGSTNSRGGVSVANGIFSVSLDFGQSFPGGARFLEIRVRQSGGGSFTTLSPRQALSSSPYSIKSLSSDIAQTASAAATATNFTAPLAGDVTGNQASTTVLRLRGINVSPNVPTNGQVLKFVSTAGAWQPAADDASGGGGTITGVTAGTGLTGGGTTGGVSLSIAPSGVGTSELANLAVTDAKIASVSPTKITGTVGSANVATNALQLGGVTADQFVQTGDPRLTDSRPPTAGSTSYIQNRSGSSQGAAVHFNIGGNGTLGGNLTAQGVSGQSVSSATGYFMNGQRVLYWPNTGGNSNLYVGFASGNSTNSAPQNTFVGTGTGDATTSGGRNTFVGTEAGGSNTVGERNSFFGSSAGFNSTTGDANAFFGDSAGGANTSGRNNSFFGTSAGGSNTTGEANVFVGYGAGLLNTTGFWNVFIGENTGQLNSSGSNNVFVGNQTGDSNTTASENTFVGSNTALNNTTGANNVFLGASAAGSNTTGSRNTIVGSSANVGSGNLSFATALGSGSVASQSNSVFLGRPAGEDTVRIPGNMNVTGATSLDGNLVVSSGNVVLFNSPIAIGASGLGTAGGTALCRNGSNLIAFCSSSLRYKKNISRFSDGLRLIDRLRPISFDWKDGQARDLGLGAEDVAAIEPLLVTYNDSGQVEGVKYDRIGVVLINAVKEQQKMIESQRSEIDALKALVCSKNKRAAICKRGR
ncbi:MAG: tail fiber domain-containing protein [Pyrinomonadaceae bacterium]